LRGVSKVPQYVAQVDLRRSTFTLFSLDLLPKLLICLNCGFKPRL
jgi:hypothetical protein